jgi:4-amino-4-deoxy-L-arabinose transferase-like glycosyltransferase
VNNQIARLGIFLLHTLPFITIGFLFTRPKDYLSSFRKNWTRERSILLMVFIAATVIRSIPGWMNAAWGNDFGIYYGITKDFAENPELFRPYSGWGSSYNYFPVLYVIVAFFHWLTGLSIAWLMPRVTPIFGGLTVLVFYFVVKEIVIDKRLALLSTAFLAANPFHIYQTSHAAPLTVGHFFMILCLYLFVRRKKTSASIGALYICSIILVVSHHLTTFFYLITIVFITFYKDFTSKEWSKDLKGEIFYILFISAFTFLYWMLIATPVYRGSIRTGLLIPSWAVICFFYIVLIILFILVIVRRKFDLFSKAPKRLKMNIWQSIFISLVACSSFVVIFSFTTIPTTGFIFEKIAIIFLIPLIIALGFAVYGGVVLEEGRKRAYVLGWLYPISISFVFATITWHEALYPFRHLEYIAYPLSILSGIGAYAYWRSLKKEEANKKESHNPMKQQSPRVFEYIVISVLILNLLSAYAVQRTTSRYEESISEQVFEVVYWMKGNVSGTNFTVASDHRISQILWAEGYNATSDEAYIIWFSENWTGCLEELQTANGSKPQIRYILIDDVMRYQGVQSNINETPRPMTFESYEKFQSPPFNLLYKSESENSEKWAELYEVDWVYIETNFP